MEASPRKSVAPLADDVIKPLADDSEVLVRLDEVLRGTTGGAQGPELVSSSGERVAIPEGVARVLARVVREMAKGNSVAVVPVHHELTTHEAAALLHVSRPHFIRMLDEGRLPFRKVGSHRRVRFDDVAAHLAREEARREALLARVARESQDLGLEF
jgi:excisionase family DNA binding protein